MINRAYYSKELQEFLTDDNSRILGELTNNHQFALEEQQRNAWIQQIEILKNELHNFGSGHIMFEYSIPRMGKRVDVIFIYSGIVFVIEFKVYAKEYLHADIDQCLDYSLDLKNFQEGSHNVQLVPILVSTEALNFDNSFEKFRDGIFTPIRANKNNLGDIIKEISEQFKADTIDAVKWGNSLYKPTPTIIEAAQALYQGHDVKEISRSDSGAINLVKTAEVINNIIEKSKKQKEKSICFVTGVPGAGKTLAGLNLANERHRFGDDEEHAVFLSGNGPLVEVLQEALARNNIENATEKITKGDALQKAKAFIQNIHHFRDDAISVDTAPIEKVVVFDEAQRAWDNDKTTAFMKIKKGIADFDMSEPEFLISVMDRHPDWAVIICLIGGGQEINTGEAGLLEWFSAIRNLYPHWNVYVSNQITDIEYTGNQELVKLFAGMKYHAVPDLHLSTSIRSFRSEHVSNFVKALLDCDKEKAKQLLLELKLYPIVLTRDFEKAKQWLKDNARGNERYGITASAKAHRLRPYGIYVESDIDAPQWFLNDKDDVRSSYYLEYVATEFHIQGLELDWTCVAWDANFRYDNGKWLYSQFTGTKWNQIKSEDKIMYLKNTYRVLLTRARQGVVIFIPKGTNEDDTRKPEFYDGTYNYLKEIGIKEI